MSKAQKTLPERVFYTQNHDAVDLPDLIEIQKNSYRWFFEKGLAELFDEISPVSDFTGRYLDVSFGDYYFDEPKFSERIAKSKNLNYEAALRVTVKLANKKSGEIKEQEIYMGDFPLMTERGTFIINGIERVIVSQLMRSSGVFFTQKYLKGKKCYGAKIIPDRGAWLEIETDAKNVMYVSVDRKRKAALTTLLRAFGYGDEEAIKNTFADVNIGDVDYMEETFKKDKAKNEEDGLIEVYKRIRPGDMATSDNARDLIYKMFFDFNRYDFGTVGRYKLNKKFQINTPITKENRVLLREDLTRIIKEVFRLNISQEKADDIDHLGNRRVRAVGELVKNKLRVGFMRMERIMKDRMSTFDVNTITPSQLVNVKPVIAVVREFFMSSQLSQFMDQHNPLAELEHKRRLSALGPGGLSRERAGFEVRDVHPTHYGRICPIATPEGPNIGLVGHFASFARINEYGFMETPYRKVIHELSSKAKELEGCILRENVKDASGKLIASKGETVTKQLADKISKSKDIKKVLVKSHVSKMIDYIDAFTEEQYISVSANVEINEDGYFLEEEIAARVKGKPSVVSVEKVDYMDVSPKQIVSIATSLIPFLEHDDATRALMGTNMQRQAVPLINPEPPIVGTGVEKRAAYDSGHVLIAEHSGEIIKLDGNGCIIKATDGKKHEYLLNKFIRSNQSTCINQRFLVDKGDKVKKGQVLSDGSAIRDGELALGQNPLIAFASWEGGNYEDAILISERVVERDAYTSIHIEEYSMDVKETKLGPEMITRDIPNIGEERLKDLDDEGIIRIGAEVSSGDLLVGKITPKGETELSPEEKLLRAIFGEQARDVKDTSLYLEHGEHGKVVDVKIFSRENGDKLPSGTLKSIQVSVAQLRKIQVGDKMAGRHGNKGVISRVVKIEDMPYLEDGTPIDIILNPLGIPSRMNIGQVLETHLGMAARKLGIKVATPVLDGVPEEVIKQQLKKANLPEDGKLELYDGRTGEKFKDKVTVGVMYMLKLDHMVEDKVHARSIGPYSMVTQQPLGGKAQFGGQRFGEMEVWALEGYGASHTLQEILTIKSDDVVGRSKTYEAIVKGQEIQKPTVPEAFNLLRRELMGLGLDVELLRDGRNIEKARSSFNFGNDDEFGDINDDSLSAKNEDGSDLDKDIDDGLDSDDDLD